MKMKKNIKWSMIYLTGTILQMGLICGIKILLEKRNISYPEMCSLLFLAFGGIEEIGWRYTFQPLLEESIPYEVASLVTFLCWGTWHYMYFYITDTISLISHDTFLIGLLGNCFILGAIYKKSQSLWLCVCYHCLLNVLSQTFTGNDLLMTLLCNGIDIFLAIALVKREPETA